ncbi:MAG: histidine kinase [Moraxellaceae bacterium]|nr:histidine kinase [Moraxellaceae bacterium]
MASIKQSPTRPAPDPARCAIPDFRNVGAILRMLLLVNVLALATALIRADRAEHILRDFVVMAGRLELPLLLCALLVYLIAPWLARRSWEGFAYVLALMAVGMTLLTHAFISAESSEAVARRALWAASAALIVTIYFRWRQIEQIPALDEARILALTARIRPHFFFNSLNGVLGVIRSDPKRAEHALEALAELFRELMRDSRELVTLCDEIDLCHRYLDLERLRLGDRLKVEWDLKYAPLNAKVPPFMLQPLLENAVYHGIEPNPEPGVITVRIARRGNGVKFEISNPATSHARRASGNRMALQNIRERLMLFFDLDANMITEEVEGKFRVTIRIPLRREEK